MRLSLFSRLTIGYLAIFLIVALASASAVLQLRHFRELTESILNVDNRILDHEKMLADSLLAQLDSQQNVLTASLQSLNYTLYGKAAGSN